MSVARDEQTRPKIIGSYQLDRRIGTGAMGEVYEATHLTLGKKVALKVLRDDGIDGETRSRFLQEGVAACRVRHPNVVDVTDAGQDDRIAYLAMALLEGETLAECLHRQKRLPLTYSIDLVLPICAALDAAHHAGVLHRDLKPGNVFLADVGRGEPEPMLLDFGISKILGPVDAHLTQNPQFLGTPLYIAPEQADGGDALPASDQYSLALTLYECLLGIRPHEKHRHSLIQLLRAVAEGPIRPPRAFDPAIPEALEDALMKALSKIPTDRFPSIREFGAALLPYASTARHALWQHAFVDAERTMASASGPVSENSSSRRVTVSVETPRTPVVSDQQAPSTGETDLAQEPPSSRIGERPEGVDTEAATPGSSDSESNFDAEQSSISRKSPPGAPAAFVGLSNDEPSSDDRHDPRQRRQRRPGGSRLFMALLALSLGLSAVFGTILVVRHELSRMESFDVDVSAQPDDATISIDGQVVGTGRFRGAYRKDGARHRLVVSHPGYETAEITFSDTPPPRYVRLDEASAEPRISRAATEPSDSLPSGNEKGEDETDEEESARRTRATNSTSSTSSIPIRPLQAPESTAASADSTSNESASAENETSKDAKPSTNEAESAEQRNDFEASQPRRQRGIQTGNLDPWAR